MAESSGTFDSAMDSWQDWQRTPWGRLRYRQAERNLVRHLPDAPARVLDVAGGNGADALALARRGYHITLMDYSADMLADAERAFAQAGLTDRLALLHADVTALDDLLAGVPGYDVVLCHNLIQYSADPAATLTSVARAARPGGRLSVIAINRYSEPLHKATRDLDPVAALAALDTDRAWTTTFQAEVRTYTAEQVVAWLRPAGHELCGHYGIRAVSDYIYDNERKHDPEFFAALERLEDVLADRLPYPLIARMFHLIFRCGASASDRPVG